MKRINWKTWTGTATFWKTLSKRSLIVFLAGVFCLFGSLGFILGSSNPQATTAGELTMNIIALATEIHRSLVPELSFHTSAFQFFGAPFPSGAVGGDLVDVVVRNDAWLGYVADVSGHGVPAGVLMSMVKSDRRTGRTDGHRSTGILAGQRFASSTLRLESGRPPGHHHRWLYGNVRLRRW